MTKHNTKAALIEDIRVQRRRLEKCLEALSPEEKAQPGLVGAWSAKDVMAHLADWEQRFIGWYAAGLRGETPLMPEPGLAWAQMDLLNQRIYEKYKDMPLEDIQAKFRASYEQVLALLEGLPEDELFTPDRYAWLKGGRMADWAAPNTSNHYYWAKTQIRKGLKAKA